MKLLAIDTSTDYCSVALYCDGAIYQQSILHAREHNKFILSLIEQVLSEGNNSLSQLDAIAFGRGPGSFTGIRLTASVVQGIAMGLDLPVIPLSSLLILAQGAYRLFGAEQVITCIDARMEEVYWSVCQLGSEGEMKFLQPEQLINPKVISLDLPGSWVAVGDGSTTYAAVLAENLKNMIVTIKPETYPQAQDALTLAVTQYQKGNLLSAENALPVYLRDLQYKRSNNDNS